MQQRDLVIIGAGTAGLSAAQHAREAGLDTLVIEEMAPGGQTLTISELQNFPGCGEGVTGIEFAMGLEKQTRSFGVEFLNSPALSIEKKNDRFIIQSPKDDIEAGAVILATGSAKKKADIPGESELSGKGVSYCATCDGPFFKNKRILVVGGGDSACDEATYLAKLSSRVTLVHRQEKLEARAALAEKVLNNPNITVRLNTRVAAIRGEKKVESVILENHTPGGETLPVEGVFIFTGSSPRSELAPQEISKDKEGHIITDEMMHSSLPGFFAAGEVRNTPFRQLVVAAGEGAVAAMGAARYIAGLNGEN